MSEGKYKPKFPRVAQLKTLEQFRNYLEKEGIPLPLPEEPLSGPQTPLAKGHRLRSGRLIGNSFSILPMEGWDGTKEGRPSEHTKRRWRNFAKSGAKLLWGCEAVAVRHDGRANPNQLLLKEENLRDFEELYRMLIQEHQENFGRTDDFLVGLQLTHSGRFSKPNHQNKMEPKILYPHPYLNQKFGLANNYPVMTDAEIRELVDDFVKAAVLAQKAGFHFVDIKHCHGYLGHELLSAIGREGDYGNSMDNRSRFLKEVVAGIRSEAPGLEIGVRVSVFDWMPFHKGDDGIGVPAMTSPYHLAFGSDSSGININLLEPYDFLKVIQKLDIELVCTTAGSPYYNPHIQRPALFPPSDGYLPPEDPLHGVARQINSTSKIKKAFSDFYIVGSAYSYLQEWLPMVAQEVLLRGMADSIGLGRMVLSYPELPADVLGGKGLKRQKLCRTFSDCTTAPRNGLISGCFPLDPYYKEMEIHEKLKKIKET
ncbi:NADH:flavin oxidoreductase [Shivajiella indica]|uniref:NADH:flavin oxidoreductase n=1 Tax=Shivajiella indica TaxID=872115 RepID=A0ABW5BBA5_9BACT